MSIRRACVRRRSGEIGQRYGVAAVGRGVLVSEVVVVAVAVVDDAALANIGALWPAKERFATGVAAADVGAFWFCCSLLCVSSAFTVAFFPPTSFYTQPKQRNE